MIERLSTTRMSPSIAAAAVLADCIVAERAAERLMQTMPEAPASSCRRKAWSKRPGAGAAVSGSVSADANLA